MQQASTIVIMVIVVSLVLWRRVRAASKPVKGSGLRLLLPMIFIFFGTLGFLNPNLHLSVKEIVLSVAFGLILSIPMILTTNYEEREDGSIYPVRSKAFVVALVALIALRFGLRSYLSELDPVELGMLFYLIAVAYIVPWRIVSYLKFRKLYNRRRTAA